MHGAKFEIFIREIHKGYLGLIKLHLKLNFTLHDCQVTLLIKEVKGSLQMGIKIVPANVSRNDHKYD